MGWMRVDDRLHSHRKAMKAGTEAMGLWVLAGSHVAGHETDGFIPDYVALRIAPNAMELGARLVAAGFWSEGEHDGDTGWWFHDWTGGTGGWNPSREDLEAERQRHRDRQARYRARNRDASRDGHRDATSDASRDAVVTPAVTTAHPIPSQPNPGTPTGSQGGAGGTDADEAPAPDESAGSASRKRSATARKGHRLPDEWWPSDSELEWFRRECPTLAGQSGAGSRATASFRDYWHGESGQRASKRDWTAAWRNWMRREESQAGRQPRPSSSGVRPTSDDRIAAFLGGGSSSAEPQPYDAALPYDDQPTQLPAGGDDA